MGVADLDNFWSPGFAFGGLGHKRKSLRRTAVKRRGTIRVKLDPCHQPNGVPYMQITAVSLVLSGCALVNVPAATCALSAPVLLGFGFADSLVGSHKSAFDNGLIRPAAKRFRRSYHKDDHATCGIACTLSSRAIQKRTPTTLSTVNTSSNRSYMFVGSSVVSMGFPLFPISQPYNVQEIHLDNWCRVLGGTAHGAHWLSLCHPPWLPRPGRFQLHCPHQLRVSITGAGGW